MSCYWIDYPATDLRIDPTKTIAILPTAAVEQHGPHLPVGVDTMINQGLCDLLAERCPAELDIRLLPIMAVGKSNEHLYAPGTLTLTAETALKAWTEIGLSVARAGVRKMLIVNSHGGNTDLISIVARELRVQAGMYCVRMGWGAGGVPDGVYSAQEMAQGIHGGDNETSLMLHFRPDTVDMAKAQDFRWSHSQGDIPPVGAVAHGWIASDVNPAGVAGEAHLATAEKGRKTADHYVSHVITVLQKIAAQDISGFEPISDAPTAR
ncbi:creatininase family protein [Cognatiyoonia sp. IB215182]|uniref:creatininase family protein n=1 Tax=Cognatiyoonia sp. IB215182 TaxID=3097353 RepID=UPI002A17ACA3|nr:creatininase family protein [Cognatiyoonia sp. IB215182]MDX8353800.1 creatininase family protein [Cognatiyoonia sp. IB215182]